MKEIMQDCSLVHSCTTRPLDTLTNKITANETDSKIIRYYTVYFYEYRETVQYCTGEITRNNSA